MSDATLFVYCDNHNTRVPVTDFAYRDGRWTEVGRDSSKTVATGVQSGLGIVLVGPTNSRTDVYRLFDLRCRRCPRSVQVRHSGLFPALDAAVVRGESCLSLSDLTASI